MALKPTCAQNGAMRAQSGFTLIELLLTLGVLGILTALAVSSWQGAFSRTHIAVHMNELVSDLQRARVEAVQLGKTFVVCKSASGTQCGGDQWESGWIVFGDSDEDNQVDPNEPIVRVQPGLPTGYTLRSTYHFANRVKYYETGDSNTAGRFVLCYNNTLAGSEVIFINFTGRVRRGEDSNDNGIPEDSDGIDITTCTP
jgi:type IV fimbrial biogenesis protein FimT